jgi:hypothetical protein
MTAPGDDLLTELGGVHPLLVFKERASGDDDVRAAFLVLDDAELVDMPFVRGGVCAAVVDLGNRAERAAPADAYLVATLDLPFNLPFHRQAALKGGFELLIARGRSRQPSGERQPALR